jgi:hypothetical protein
MTNDKYRPQYISALCNSGHAAQQVIQEGETNVMHFLFNLLRIKGLYMFRALLAQFQEAQHKQNLVYWLGVMSIGC